MSALWSATTREGVNPMGTQLFIRQPCLLSLSIWLSLSYPYTAILCFCPSFLFFCWGVISRCPMRCVNCGHVPLTMGVMCCCLFTLSIIQESTKKSTPFFYFNCISFGYIWHPGKVNPFFLFQLYIFWLHMASW